ncbi:hypothetical protein MVLG_02802 [Microbotryum lychnidis-dioicae p1A1 Lamole]|uniref:Enoyl reductase (ER) domain-containing protein n=1 Tax=Microbotryum lychnidis-dioicae (strain p1A1 Lamole / MvSl-1064) TaxID=683840 RepID=U5H698_USTV1|nr:hypothetical protein MVLG_02802 [Microbotryum lychnidis-dioicae p1A1 Lamole]|eukprot:KDE06914.1 hypothetical protein MVLG_02802 [Microbotryum lychnidis-dioicae p1A1 Lamole]
MPTSTQALLLKGVHEPFVLSDVSVDDPRAGEVLVQLVASGICQSDLSVQNGVLPGQFPSCVGHEGSGIVKATGEGVTHLQEGDSVLLSFNFCSQCRSCHAQKGSQCKMWPLLNFGLQRASEGQQHFAEEIKTGEKVKGFFFGQSSFSGYTLAAANSCIKVDADTDELALLAPLGCGIQTGAGAVLKVLKPEPTSSIGVWGLGGVGISAICASSSLKVRNIIAIDIIPTRLSIALECGATHAINASTEDVQARIKEITQGEMLDYAVEASGVKACMYAAWSFLAHGGKLCQIGVFPKGTEVSLDINATQVRHLTFIGNVEGASHPPVFIPQLIELRKAGYLPLEKFSKQFALADHEEAFKAIKNGSVIKPILRF